jgi:AcrR family transcriptional regulator
VGEVKGQAQRGAATRRAIVDAALDVFATHGYRASALADIAEVVGLTPAGILYHFGTKEALLLEVIAERDRRASATIGRFPDKGGLVALTHLVGLAAAIERERGLAAVHTVLQAESFEPERPAHLYFVGRSRVVRSVVQRILTDAQAAGEVAAGVDCPAKAAEFVAYLEGAAVLWLLDATVSLTDLYRTYITDFVATVSA